MQSKATIAFASGLADANTSIKRAQQTKAILNKHRKTIGKILRSLERLGVSDMTVSANTFEDKPNVYVNMRDLESFKDAKLIAVLDYLSDLTETARSKDWAEYLNIDYRFESNAVNVYLGAYVKEDSPTCRKVLVGTELQTVAKYQIVCD